MKFLCLSLAVLSAWYALPLRAAEPVRTDVVVVGATPAGVAAAVAAARSGSKVILLEEFNHVGGVVAGGLTNADISKKGAVGGLFAEFTRRIREHYLQAYGEQSDQVRLCRNGYYFEASIGEKTYRELLAGEKNITLMLQQRVVGARVTGADGTERDAEKGKRIDGAKPRDFGDPVKLTSIIAESLIHPGQQKVFAAGAFIDATYEGDLAALSGVPYRVGRESAGTFNETHAGHIYLRFKDYNPLPGSTGKADDGIQAFCFRFHMIKDAANMTPLEQPVGYNRDDYKDLLADIQAGKLTKLNQAIQFFPLPNGKFEINSDHPHGDTGVPSQSLDLAEENWGWPEAGPEERARIFQRYWAYNAGLVWFLKTDPAVPESIREEAKPWGLPKDEFADHGNWPHHIYVRQGRRIWGEYNFTENDAKTVEITGLPKRKEDGIAVVEFEFDSHAVHKYDPEHPGVREGYIFIAHEPLQLPYRSLVPQKVDGLLVPVACSASHVGYQAIRMEPVFMALGEACGIASSQAIHSKVEVRKVNVPDLQREIIKRGGVVLYENQPLRPEGL